MKIIQYSPTSLILQFKPVAIWIIGSILVTTALIIVLFGSTYTTLHCDRGNKCELISSNMLSSNINRFPVSELIGSNIESSTTSEGDKVYRVVLKTKNNEIPLTWSYSSGYNEKEHIKNQISAFVKDKSMSTLQIDQDERTITLVIGGILFIISMLMVILIAQITCYFDYTTNSLTILKQTLIRKSYKQFQLSDIDHAFVQSSTDSDGTAYRIALKFKSGDEVPITNYYTSGISSKQRDVDRINEFLNSVNKYRR